MKHPSRLASSGVIRQRRLHRLSPEEILIRKEMMLRSTEA